MVSKPPNYHFPPPLSSVYQLVSNWQYAIYLGTRGQGGGMKWLGFLPPVLPSDRAKSEIMAATAPVQRLTRFAPELAPIP